MINMNSTVLDAVVTLADGNPGAVTALAELIKANEGEALLTMLRMDELGMTGSVIWVAYKDFANYDIPALVQGVAEQSPRMLGMIEKRCGMNWRKR